MTREAAVEWFETHMPIGKITPVAKQAYEMAIASLIHPRRNRWSGCGRGALIVRRQTQGKILAISTVNAVVALSPRRRGRN